ncbi:MAG: peptidoglycan editing factor PgeF [Pseudomonadota bacterium]
MLELIKAAPLSDQAGLEHGFTTRKGGVSRGPYDSLNLTWSRGDEKAAVTENRRRLSEALGGPTLVFANQVHGRTVLRVDSPPQGVWSAGEADALMTDQPSLALCAQCADCVPVVLFDPVRRAIAAVHSGWRGAVQNIVGATLDAMNEAYATRPGDVRAAIGPAISKARYRVGAEVLDQFQALFGALDTGLIGQRDVEGGAGLDVAEAVRRQLVAHGVAEHAISLTRACTFAEQERFFSSRRAARDGHAGQFGGQVGVVALTD